MLLRDVIQTSGKSLRGLAKVLDCSHNHLSQVANLKKPLSAALGLRIVRSVDARFSMEEQQAAFEAAQAEINDCSGERRADRRTAAASRRRAPRLRAP